MDPLEAWKQQLDRPTDAFFAAAAARMALDEGPKEATREAIRHLVPRIGWSEYHPHLPMGLCGLRAVWRLKDLLAEQSFRRALATQLHMLAHEGRASAGRALGDLGVGSGSLENLDMALATRRPSIAWGECQGLDPVEPAHFDRIAAGVQDDMSHLGHKALFCFQFQDLHARLGHPKASGRRLLGLTAWMAAQEPVDTFWAQRAQRRLDGVAAPRVAPATLSMSEHQRLAREVCDLGLVALLDAWAGHVRSGMGSGDLLAALVLAASEKQLDARRDLEGKTAWTFHYLATLGGMLQPVAHAATWLQAAALVNLFPTDEPEDRLAARPPRDADARLEDAILDAEPTHALYLSAECQPSETLRVLADCATRNDPVFNHASQVMAVASAADLLDRVPDPVAGAMVGSLAKSLANAQGGSDLGRLADRALAARSGS